jgi:hypothetical protein
MDVQAFVRQAVQSLIDRCLKDLGPRDTVGLEIKHPGLTKTILVPFGPRSELSADTIAQKIEDVMQSNQDFSLDDRMEWKFTFIKNTMGAGPNEGV